MVNMPPYRRYQHSYDPALFYMRFIHNAYLYAYPISKTSILSRVVFAGRVSSGPGPPPSWSCQRRSRRPKTKLAARGRTLVI